MRSAGISLVALLLLLGAGAPGEGEEARFLSLSSAVVAAHDRADRLEAKDPGAAALELEVALALQFPDSDEARSLRADLFARLGALRLAAGEPRAALAAARQGLAEQAGRPESAFGAQLRLREGEALEALGDEAGALESYGEVVALAKRLLAARRAKEGGR